MLKAKDYSDEELERKREEAERKARRGEIDPVHEYTFTLISKVISNLHSYDLIEHEYLLDNRITETCNSEFHV